MPTNRKESLIFTIMMCAFMVFFMSIYSFSFHMGFSFETIKKAWMGFPLAFLVGFVCDWFIVANFAKKIAFSIAKNHNKPIALILCISTTMVSGMVILMSLFGTIAFYGFTSAISHEWLMNIGRNFIVALPLQIFIAGPVIRHVFRWLIPVGYTG